MTFIRTDKSIMETIKDNFLSRKGYSNVVLTIILMVTLLTGLVSITLRSPMVGLDEMGITQGVLNFQMVIYLVYRMEILHLLEEKFQIHNMNL